MNLAGAALQVQRQQFGKRVLGRNIVRPAIGRSDGAVELLMGVREALRALIVEIGERARFERRGGLGILGRMRSG